MVSQRASRNRAGSATQVRVLEDNDSSDRAACRPCFRPDS